MINWKLYKGRTEGRYAQRSMKAFEEFCELLENENYKLEGEYVNASTKVKLECDKGHGYKVTPHDFKNGRRCPICAGNNPKASKLDFIKQVKKEGYKLVGEYVNANSKIELQCDKGHKYFVQPYSFKNGNRCPICYSNHTELAKLDFIKQVENENYKLIGNYVNNSTKVELECNKGHRYSVQPYSFKDGHRCPHCSGKDSETSKLDFIKQVESEGYKLIGKYVNSKIKIELECNKGHRYSVQPNAFKNGNRCPHCGIISHGENLTKEVLKEYNCRFETQKKFRGLVGLGGRQLSYDFFVDDYLLIEIQGEQHYKSFKHFGGEEKFRTQQKHDKLKREYAKKNGYELLEIPYFSVRDLDKLEQILRDKIEDYKHNKAS
ncbi:hypothetical protein PTM93_06020 [Clostridium perfringens]|nr:hypothetical protein [Clostridium perfringens]MDK0409048.1 hypothetical protein [Clostridium perfringens]MDK0443307.1 hypothetical protein [Clostridium perfringens]MDK0496851.1 hypothetical protein [Clostridium perfringens]MDK0499957.1 hypothetical protein [Clostridium perfringens]